MSSKSSSSNYIVEKLRKLSSLASDSQARHAFDVAADLVGQHEPVYEASLRMVIAKELYEYPEYRGVMKIAAGLVGGTYEQPDWNDGQYQEIPGRATVVPPSVDEDFSERMEQVFSRISYTQNRLMALNLPASEAGLLVAADLQEQAALTVVSVLESIDGKFPEATPAKKPRAVLKKSRVVNRDAEEATPSDHTRAIQERVDEEAKKTVQWMKDNPEKLRELSSGPMGTAMIPDIDTIELESEKEEQIRAWIKEHPEEVFAPGNPNVPGFLEAMVKRQVASAAAVQWMEDQKAKGVVFPWELPEDEFVNEDVLDDEGNVVAVRPVLPDGTPKIQVNEDGSVFVELSEDSPYRPDLRFGEAGEVHDESEAEYWDSRADALRASQARGEAGDDE